MWTCWQEIIQMFASACLTRLLVPESRLQPVHGICFPNAISPKHSGLNPEFNPSIGAS